MAVNSHTPPPVISSPVISPPVISNDGKRDGKILLVEGVDGAGVLKVTVGGRWVMEKDFSVEKELAELCRFDLSSCQTLEVSSKALSGDVQEDQLESTASTLVSWDNSLLLVLIEIGRIAHQRNKQFVYSSLPTSLVTLLGIALRSVAEGERNRQPLSPESTSGNIQRFKLVAALGGTVRAECNKALSAVEFIGQCSAMMHRFLRGKARLNPRDMRLFMAECGYQALPICLLISFLVGTILAFVGALQLQQFGAELYVANLVGIAMVREMGAMMVGIIMAGRTGSAYAAQLGTMQVNEEVDALVTFGIRPLDVLVLPRLLAISLMVPCLCVFADIFGLFGGLVIGVLKLDLTARQYVSQTVYAVVFKDVLVGFVKSFLFGIIVALSGCYHGLNSGRSAQAVGEAATKAVVTAIVWIIVADAVVIVICSVLKI